MIWGKYGKTEEDRMLMKKLQAVMVQVDRLNVLARKLEHVMDNRTQSSVSDDNAHSKDHFT